MRTARTIEYVAHIRQTSILAEGMYRIEFEVDHPLVCVPGQFVNLEIPGYLLRRPLAIADCSDDGMRIVVIVRVVGAGTADLVLLKPGARLRLLAPLGDGFNTAVAGVNPLLLGGGSGIPPLFFLAKFLCSSPTHPDVHVALGFRSAQQAYLIEQFEELGCAVHVATEDGSAGRQGRVTDFLQTMPHVTQVFACGPDAMLRTVQAWARDNSRGAQLSVEAHMACGFGACLGCAIPTVSGNRRVCVDGPVFDSAELVFASESSEPRLQQTSKESGC
ncbi:MAG: dihydroorotate dehydrogenase electron transfer subunit [Actinomycetaceae bacterium]|nr:dihydroorotate dehydrogenase electron transfer subunit [Actinomycetaceae bacterium]MDY6083591.1 dihydroorotate dehydrogenase electron transfer subunit [Actinomycetaceae bacterium]